MNQKDYDFLLTSEECAELAVELSAMSIQANKLAIRLSKAQRFTAEETQPGQFLNNGARVAEEALDLITNLETLAEKGYLHYPEFAEHIVQKKAKLTKFMALSIERGTLNA